MYNNECSEKGSALIMFESANQFLDKICVSDWESIWYKFFKKIQVEIISIKIAGQDIASVIERVYGTNFKKKSK